MNLPATRSFTTRRGLLAGALLLLGTAPAAQAQLRLPNLGARLESAVNSRLSQRTDQAISKGLDKAESTATKTGKGDEKDQPSPDAPAASGQASTRYDFVPGAQVLFEDKLAGEEIGEFPSRWELLEGSAEVATAEGQPVIMLANGAAIAPLFKQADYLPEAFTLEMDVFLGPRDRCNLWFWDKRKGKQTANGELGELEISQNQVHMPHRNLGQTLAGAKPVEAGRWRHLELAFNQRSLKVYLDQHRLLNLPTAAGRPTALTLGAVREYHGTKDVLVRHVRLAAGGKDLYARLAAEGRLVRHDILFDPGQAVIKPASQPALDQLASLLQSQPALRFRIEGHTDADGEAAANLRLSRARAEAVRAALVQAGIAADRLTATGCGATKPLAPGLTASAKAQNRRVEFVKL